MAEREPVSTENCRSQYEDHELVPADPGAGIPWATLPVEAAPGA